jgi:hypothetical protein
MFLSIQTRHAILFPAALLLAFVQSAHAQAISIQSASPNTAQTVLSISGSNFCVTPTVTLGSTGLLVLTAVPTLITASLPALPASTYYLIVSCGTLAGRTAYFDVTIGAPAAAGKTAAGGCWVDGQRYADCGNGTVTDSVTGLIWLKDAACASLGVPGFAAANAAAAALHDGQCGLTDGSAAGQWRVPTRAEWQATLAGPLGLIATFGACSNPPLYANDGVTCYNNSAQGPGFSQHAFIDVVSGGYWSSSVYELDPTYRYIVDLSGSSSGGTPHFSIAQVSALNVWPVRNGSQ